MTILLKQLHLWFGDVCRHIEGEEEAKRLYSKLSNTSHPRIKGDALRSRCAQQATNSVWGKPDPALSRFQNDALVAARVLAFLNSKRLPVTAVRATLLAHQITDAASLSPRAAPSRGATCSAHERSSLEVALICAGVASSSISMSAPFLNCSRLLPSKWKP